MSNDRPCSKKKDFTVSFILVDSSEEVIHRVREEFAVAETLSGDSWIAFVKQQKGPRLLIIDSDDKALYESSLQQEIRASETSLMYITIDSTPHYHADIVFNQNILALSQTYTTEPHTRLLLGPNYFVFKEEFRSAGRPYRDQSIYSMLVAFGGGDQYNLTLKALQVMLDNSFDALEHIHVVCGGLNPHLEQIRKVAEGVSNGRVSLHVDTQHMMEIMEECDAALISFGLTFWELVVLGVPALVIGSSAREKMLFDALEASRYFYPIGTYDQPDLPQRMHKAMKSVLSGNRKYFKSLPNLQAEVNPRGLENLITEITKILQ